MKIIKTAYIFTFFLLSQMTLALAQDALDSYLQRIDEAQNGQELYPVRFGIERYAKNPSLTLQEQKKLIRAFDELADAFRRFNHYRNATDVYRNYLALNEVYLKNYNQFLEDSLKKKHREIEVADLNKIKTLDAEIASLKQTKEAVSGLKTKYYTFGTIGTIALIIIFLFIFITRNKAIQLTNEKLQSSRAGMQEIQSEVLESKITGGSVNFSRAEALENIAILESIESHIQASQGSKPGKEIEAIRKSKEIFSRIAEAG